jgi:ribosomal protein L3
MHGRHGNALKTLASVPVELIDREHNIIAVRGAVPGAFNGFVYLVF